MFRRWRTAKSSKPADAPAGARTGERPASGVAADGAASVPAVGDGGLELLEPNFRSSRRADLVFSYT
jgi:hypothetical protein